MPGVPDTSIQTGGFSSLWIIYAAHSVESALNLQASWNIAEQVNVLRGLQGAGHGRTLPTGVSADLALLVVREACSVAEFMLTTLERQYGRVS